MKTESLEKIRKIIVILFVLFFSFLTMLITFCSLRVHAEEQQTYTYYLKYNEDFTDSWPSRISYDFKNIESDVYELALIKTGKSKTIVSAFTGESLVQDEYLKVYLTDDFNSPTTGFSCNGEVLYYRNSKLEKTDNKTFSRVGFDSVLHNPAGNYWSDVETDMKIFNSLESARLYVETGDTSGIINGGSIDNPDFEDTAYAFTGFTANNKMTATWTGTTERSYLKDQEVEEYVRVNYYFADKEAQDTIKQADAYPDEFATADKTLTIDVSGLKPDDENWFLRYIRITPCYRQAGLGVWGDFYHGSDVYVYFDVKGNIEKVIQKSKPTDLNKGNMVYDSSIGYLQNVIYTEQKTHDGSGRQATFKWSTLKSLPDDAQIEIVAQNFYIEWFNKKTEENFIYKEYGEDCFYSAGSYSFNANTPVWTWLKEKEIDPFSIKTQSYGSTEYYLRIVVYNDSDSLYHYGGWVKVDIKSKDTTIMPSTDVETGGFDDSSGLWNQDTASSDSYHYSTDDKGKLTGNIDVNSWEDLNMNSFTWMYRNMQSMVSSLGEFPAMVNAVFGYLPVQYITSIGVLLVAIVLLRFLGR